MARDEQEGQKKNPHNIVVLRHYPDLGLCRTSVCVSLLSGVQFKRVLLHAFDTQVYEWDDAQLYCLLKRIYSYMHIK
jgi:hypothetical protein